jgi:nucleoside-diphosphate-sugar epimerase
MLLMADRNEEIGSPFNIGNPEERTVLDLATKVIALTGSSSKIVKRELPVDDPKVRCPDSRRTISILGWKPEVGIDQGLQKTIEYFKTVVQK